MIATPTSKLSFDQYQRVCELSEKRYELEQGELIEMTPPTWLHLAIAKFLERTFDREIERLSRPWEAFREPGAFRNIGLPILIRLEPPSMWARRNDRR